MTGVQEMCVTLSTMMDVTGTKDVLELGEWVDEMASGSHALQAKLAAAGVALTKLTERYRARLARQGAELAEANAELAGYRVEKQREVWRDDALRRRMEARRSARPPVSVSCGACNATVIAGECSMRCEG